MRWRACKKPSLDGFYCISSEKYFLDTSKERFSEYGLALQDMDNGRTKVCGSGLLVWLVSTDLESAYNWNWIVGYSTGYGFIGFGGFGWLSEDLDISFLLVQRCKKLSMPLNLFGLERFFFDKWNKITGKR